MIPTPEQSERLLALAARCEAVEGPDRDIDRALCPLVGIRVVDEGHPLGRCYYDANGHGVPLPLFTASIDAAMMLVPKGCLHMARTIWDAAGKTAGLARVDQYRGEGGSKRWFDGFDACAATPALALCAAAIRARAGDGA